MPMKLANTSASSVRGWLLVWMMTSAPVMNAAAMMDNADNPAETPALRICFVFGHRISFRIN